MNDRECIRTSTNVWRSLCDHCELMANCIRKPIRHTFATGETSITFETPQKRPRMLTNSYECLAIITNSWRTAFVSPFAIYSPQCETSIRKTDIIILYVECFVLIFYDIAEMQINYDWALMLEGNAYRKCICSRCCRNKRDPSRHRD